MPRPRGSGFFRNSRRRYFRRRRFYPRPFQGSGSPYGRLIDPENFSHTIPSQGGLDVDCRTIEFAGPSSSDESVHLFKCSIQFLCSITTTGTLTDDELGAGILAYPVSVVRRVPTTSAPALSATEVVNSPDAIIGHPFPVTIRSGGYGSVVLRRPVHLMNNALGGYQSVWEGGVLFTGLNQDFAGLHTLHVGMVPRYYQRFQYPGRTSG